MTTKRARTRSRVRASVAVLALVAFFAVLAPVAIAATPPPLFAQFGENCGDEVKLNNDECGGGAGETDIPHGVAVNLLNGHIYIADRLNSRIDEFSPWGAFVRAWGWGVADGSAEAQICGPGASPPTAGCQKGIGGTGSGQFSPDQFSPQSVAVDGAGNVYVVDTDNFRVEEFDAEGHFLLMIGGEVDKTTSANVCTAESGDTCGPGIPGSAPAQFDWRLLEGWKVFGSFIAVGPGNTLYVGDKNRVQTFTAAGAVSGSVPVPGESPQALTVDGSGNLYLTYAVSGESSQGVKNNPQVFTKANVHKIGPAGEPLCTAEVRNPRAVAVGDDGFYVVNAALTANESDTNGISGVLQFDSGCAKVDTGAPEPGFGADRLTHPLGLATSEACGIKGTQIIVPNSDFHHSFVALYGESPDPTLCPPPSVPPSINAQFATAADSGGATLKAKINPHFWPDTRYYVQYGTGKCSEGRCDQEQPAAPGSLLTKSTSDIDVTSADVFIEGLQPNTTYHYRFVAQSGGGGPVLGVGGMEGAEGKEGAFHTPSLASESSSACPNQVFRTGAGARLPDCRAYELVSPLDKNNGDVASGAIFHLAQAATSGERMTFSSYRSFVGSEGAPIISEYLAKRSAGEGWVTNSISPPRDSRSLYPLGGTTGFQYKGFSEDLCSGWLVQDTDVPLTSTAPLGVPSLYRGDFCGVGSPYELLTSTPPGFGFESLRSSFYPAPQGSSADGSHSVFRADAALAVEGGPAPAFTCATGNPGETTFYRWLRNGVPIPGAIGPAYTPGAEDAGQSVQCQMTVSDAEGASVATSKVSVVAPVPALPAPNPGQPFSVFSQPPGAPALSGTPAAGETLTCTPGAWKGAPSFTYQWLRESIPIEGATASTYTLQAPDTGSAIQCELLGTNASGAAVADSEPLTIDARPPIPGTGPTVAGTVAVGQVLTCSPGTWSNSPTFSYQWLRGGANIAAATGSTYTPVAADEGKSIQCRVSGANADATAQAVSAAAVVPPAPGTAPPTLTILGSTSGPAQVGETLTCGPSSWTGGPAFSRQWLRNGGTIAGKTAETYKLTAADRRKTVQCQVTATNAGGAVIAIEGPVYIGPAPPVANVEAYSVYQVYESYGGDKLRLVSILPDGSPATTHSSVGLPNGTVGAFDTGSFHRAVSEDGSRVFWTASQGTDPPGGSGGNGEQPGALYLRLNATELQSAVSGEQCTETTRACTIAISEAFTTRFLAASKQGTRVLYTVGGNGVANGELYEAAIEESAGQMVATPHLIAGGVNGVMGTSDDLSRAYFVSTQVLTGADQNSNGDEAQSGQPNLYLYERGVGNVFVATLEGSGPRGPSALEPKFRSSRVAPSGLAAAFTAVAPLTGFDNTDVQSGEADAEVFLFDATANGGEGVLRCVSCRPSGARPKGRQVRLGGTIDTYWAAAILPGWVTQTHPGNALSESGKRLFFDSYDALVPGDTNGVEDAYEWEMPGEGDCTEQMPAFSEANGGCIFLISSGQGADDSEFLDATPNGSDVFFATQASLLVQDYGLNDVYDARVGGGFPAPATAPAGCEGEACQGTAEAPNDPTPASSAFQGAGNVREAPAKKKSHRKKHRAKKKIHKKAKKNRANANGRAHR